MKMMQISDLMLTVTDYVANGSFKSLNENVKYTNEKNYARLIRLVDYNNNFDNKNAIYVSEESYNFLSKTKLFGDEIIISNVGANLGTVFKCPKLDIPMTLGPNSIMFKSKINDKYLYYYFCSNPGQKSILSLVSGSAMPKFNKTDFKKLIVPVPDESIQQHIVDTISFALKCL
ncbi:MAG: restriction endonuclease subunit S [Acholeplasmatales bacterium]|nr:restriction endonuclease subunit S [Acholeplasmatales bacterium]